MISSLGYLQLGTTKRAEWAAFAADVLGMQPHGDDDRNATRLQFDERLYRIELVDSADDDLKRIGWEVPDAAALEGVRSALRAHGVAFTECDDKLADERGVTKAIATVDPGGYELEIFYGQKRAAAAFVSPTGAQFVTGNFGMGHIVLTASEFAKQMQFYMDVLGFRLSDTMRMGGATAAFMRCNPRHHSLALIDVPGLRAAHHFMVEVSDLGMVGRGLDRIKAHNIPLMMDLGQHSNDEMISFYATTPSGIGVEYGFNGLLVDDSTWSVTELAGPSLWGHRAPAAPVG